MIYFSKLPFLSFAFLLIKLLFEFSVAFKYENQSDFWQDLLNIYQC